MTAEFRECNGDSSIKQIAGNLNKLRTLKRFNLCLSALTVDKNTNPGSHQSRVPNPVA